MGGEAFFNQEEIFYASRDRLQELKKGALNLKDKSIRICLHSSPEDDLHEMLIVHKKDPYENPIDTSTNQSHSIFYTVLPKTEFVAFHEVTNGPFRR